MRQESRVRGSAPSAACRVRAGGVRTPPGRGQGVALLDEDRPALGLGPRGDAQRDLVELAGLLEGQAGEGAVGGLERLARGLLELACAAQVGE